MVDGGSLILVVNTLVKNTFFSLPGLIDFLVSKHKIAQELREKLIFKVKHLKHKYILGDRNTMHTVGG